MTAHHMSIRRASDVVHFVLRTTVLVLTLTAGATTTYSALAPDVAAESKQVATAKSVTKSTVVAKPVTSEQPDAPAQADGGNSTAAASARTVAATRPLVASNPATCSVASYNLTPSRPALSATGVNKQIDAPVYYGIGTDNPANLVAQAQLCARQQPGLGGYEGLTGYAMNWSYIVAPDGAGQCKLADVRVGIHINQMLPALESNRPAAVQAARAPIIARLAVHENEHTAIDVAQASALAAQLSSLVAPCGDIAAMANQLTSSAAANLRAQNNALDAATNHGRN